MVGRIYDPMANTYFQFKAFTIHQESCAMKVCTDACLFGAWAASLLSTGRVQASSCLDIGAGTGLLSLMLAQQSAATITGIELDKDAAIQATENVAASPWNKQVEIINMSVLDYSPGKPFDFIISNPPFFEADLTSPDIRRNKAMHEVGLTLMELMNSIGRLISENGHAAVLLPYHRLQEAIAIAKNAGFGIIYQVLVMQSENHHYFRAMLLMGKQSVHPPVVEEISIRSTGNNYSEKFTSLLKPYYLYL